MKSIEFVYFHVLRFKETVQSLLNTGVSHIFWVNVLNIFLNKGLQIMVNIVSIAEPASFYIKLDAIIS